MYSSVYSSVYSRVYRARAVAAGQLTVTLSVISPVSPAPRYSMSVLAPSNVGRVAFLHPLDCLLLYRKVLMSH